MSALIFGTTIYVLRYSDPLARVLFRLPFQPALVAFPAFLLALWVLLRTARRPTTWGPRLWTVAVVGLTAYASYWTLNTTDAIARIERLERWEWAAFTSAITWGIRGEPDLHGFVVASAGAASVMALRTRTSWPDKRWVQLAFPFTLVLGFLLVAPASVKFRDWAVENEDRLIARRLEELKRRSSEIAEPPRPRWADFSSDFTARLSAMPPKDIHPMVHVLDEPAMWPAARVLQRDAALIAAWRDMVSAIGRWPGYLQCPPVPPAPVLTTGPSMWCDEPDTEVTSDEKYPEPLREKYFAFIDYSKAYFAKARAICKSMAPKEQDVSRFQDVRADELASEYERTCRPLLDNKVPTFCSAPWTPPDSGLRGIALGDLVKNSRGRADFDAEILWQVAHVAAPDARRAGCRDFQPGIPATQVGDEFVYCNIYPPPSTDRPSRVQAWLVYQRGKSPAPRITYLAVHGPNARLDSSLMNSAGGPVTIESAEMGRNLRRKDTSELLNIKPEPEWGCHRNNSRLFSVDRAPSPLGRHHRPILEGNA